MTGGTSRHMAPNTSGCEVPVTDSGLECLILAGHLHQQRIDGPQLRHDLGLEARTFSSGDIVRAAKRSGLRAKRKRYRAKQLEHVPCPVIAERRDGSFVLVAAVDQGILTTFDPKVGIPSKIDLEQFAADWTGTDSSGTLILLVPRETESAWQRFHIGWFLAEILKYRKTFGCIFALSFCVQFMGLASPIFFQLIIDKVLVHHGLTTLHVLIIGLGAVSLCEVMGAMARNHFTVLTAAKVDTALGAKLFDRLLKLPVAWFQSRQTGQTVARVRELETIREFLTGNAITLVLDVLFTVLFFAVMIIYSWVLTLIVLATIPAFVLLAVVVTPVLRRRIEERFNRGAENQAFLVEAVVGIETLKSTAVEPQALRRWNSQLARYVTANVRTVALSNIAGQCAQLFAKIMTVAVLWYGAQLVIAGALTVGELVAFNIFAGRVIEPILRMAQMWNEFQQFRISAARVADILNARPEAAHGSGGTLGTIEGRVEFRGVTFRYEPGKPEALSDISLDVAPGEILGIVGTSGSGKSTLAKLVQRLRKPERGSVLIDGVDLSVIDPKLLRRQIGVVLQENVLFNRTVAENIALADPSIPPARIMDAAKLAGAHDFILELPGGYDTVIEERGGNLSGGQRQRIAIARALVTDPRILILDEATSALDYESELAIQRNMAEITAGRTVFIIAHRLAAIRNATRIIAIERGRLVEDGTHDELLARDGRYASLHRLQGLASTTA